MTHLYSTLELFFQWIKTGVYDFCHLPHGMKKDLPEEVEKYLTTEQLIKDYNGIVIIYCSRTYRKTF